MSEKISVNGTDLSTLVRDVESLAGLLRAPARRGDNLEVAGRHGRLRRADRPYDSGEIVLPLWVFGADAGSGINLYGDASVTAFYQQVDELMRIFSAPTLMIDHELPDGSIRRAVGELAQEPQDFTRQLGHPLFGRVVMVVSLPDAFWADVEETSTGPFSLATGAERELVEFAGATAPMTDLDITFGPGNNPELWQDATGAFVAYDGLIGPGQTLTIHCDDTHATPLVGTGGLVPDYSRLRYRPPRWFELDPTVDMTVRLVHTGGGSQSVTIAGRRKFLTG